MSNKNKDQLAKTLGIDKGDANADLTKVTGQIDYSWLYSILDALPVKQMNSLQICKAVYDRCIVKFSSEFFEERALRQKYEKTIVKKVGEIIKLEQELVTVRALLPKGSETAGLSIL